MASWKQLLQAAMDSHAHLKHSSFIQLATLGTNGRPANRTVVFRGFLDGSDRIRMHTDSRSCKIEEIKHCPFGEICWYFTESWEQFRINGKIEIIDKSTTDAIKVEVSNERNLGNQLLESLNSSTWGLPLAVHIKKDLA
ncbi:Pyridoxal 5'-phosphate synthase protein [Dioscorea alata]|uniref:Pyridoxal 5'-phosphate synthase protein n=1 Tax=Dioscorea alata TaxID=55571 RepID=A0ACB7UH08_DIOAL|nr:Pyridoxal 5'-phosphate synthase protein [Dioscorea alata]